MAPCEYGRANRVGAANVRDPRTRRWAEVQRLAKDLAAVQAEIAKIQQG